MSLLINCGRCESKMGSLQPYKIRDDKYICIPCFESLEKEQTTIQKIYNSIPDEDLWSMEVLQEPDNYDYDLQFTYLSVSDSNIESLKRLQESTEAIQILTEKFNKSLYSYPNKYLYTDPTVGIIKARVKTQTQFINRIREDLYNSRLIPAPSVNNSITFYNNLNQQLSSGTLLNVTIQSNTITLTANVMAMFDLFSIAQISWTQNNTYTSYKVNLVSNNSVPDTHYSFLINLEFNIV